MKENPMNTIYESASDTHHALDTIKTSVQSAMRYLNDPNKTDTEKIDFAIGALSILTPVPPDLRPPDKKPTNREMKIQKMSDRKINKLIKKGDFGDSMLARAERIRRKEMRE